MCAGFFKENLVISAASINRQNLQAVQTKIRAGNLCRFPALIFCFARIRGFTPVSYLRLRRFSEPKRTVSPPAIGISAEGAGVVTLRLFA